MNVSNSGYCSQACKIAASFLTVQFLCFVHFVFVDQMRLYERLSSILQLTISLFTSYKWSSANTLVWAELLLIVKLLLIANVILVVQLYFRRFIVSEKQKFYRQWAIKSKIIFKY